MDSLKIIARYRDGRMIKGTTSNFDPKRRRFHLTPLEAAPGQLPVPIALKNLKAVFVVRDFTGDPLREESRQFNSEASAYGKKLQVTFEDGEVLCGASVNVDLDGLGFFLFPADAGGNNKRMFVVNAAVADVREL